MATYSELIVRDNIESNYLVVVKPRRYAVSWTLSSGTTYYSAFDYGRVIQLFDAGAEKVADTTTSPASGKWFFDKTTNLIWYNRATAPSDTNIIVVYELYFGTNDLAWGRTPDTPGSDVSFFTGAIVSSPAITTDTSDSSFGFFPSSGASIQIANEGHWIEKHIHDSSFNLSDCDIYHALGKTELSGAAKLIYRSIVQSLSYEPESLTFNLTDRNNALTKQFKTVIDANGEAAYASNYFTQAVFSGLDPSCEGRAIRSVFGRVEGLVATNVDWVEVSPGANDNRIWIVGKGISTMSVKTPSVIGIAGSVLTLSSVDGIYPGDTLAYYTNTSPYPYGLSVGYGGRVTAVDRALKKVTVTSTTWPDAGSKYVRRGPVSAIFWKGPDGIIQKLIDGRDYRHYQDATNDVWGFELNSDFETNAFYGSISWGNNKVKPSDSIWCTAYGNAPTLTISPSTCPADSSGCFSNGAGIIAYLLKMAGVPDAEIDRSTFASKWLDTANPLSFAVPYAASDDFPIMRDIVGDICMSLLLRVFVGSDGKWTLKSIAPIASTTSISEGEIFDGSFKAEIDYSEIATTCAVGYALREIDANANTGLSRSYTQYTASSAARLHRSNKQTTFNTLLRDYTDAGNLALKLSLMFRDRKATYSLKAPIEYIQKNIGDAMAVSRNQLPGFVNTTTDDVTRNMVIIGLSKSSDGIQLTLDDQKGIEWADDNGLWA